MRRHAALLCLALAASVLNGASSTYVLYLINGLIVGEADMRFSVSLYAFLVLVVFASGVAAQILLVRITATTVQGLRLTLARRIVALPLAKLESLGTNRLYATLTQDTGAIANTLGALPMFSFHVAILLGGLTYLGWLSMTWLLAVLGVIGVAVAIYQWLSTRARRLMTAYRQEQDRLFKQFEALTLGAKELRLNATRRESFFAQGLVPSTEALRRHYQSAHAAWAIGVNWANLLAFLMVGTLAVAYHYAEWMTSALLTSYALTLLFLRAHFGGALNLIPVFAQGNVALSKIEQLGLAEPDQQDDTPQPLDNGWSTLSLHDVRYRYPDREGDDGFEVGPISVTIKRGELVFVTGGNGSGKSTFAKLLTLLYKPDDGDIRVEDRRIDDGYRDWYQSQFYALFSDYFLFDSVVGEIDDSTVQRASEYLERLALGDKVRLEGSQFSTTALSSGQRRRLALLSAYLEDRPIYIFDEWAADQDRQFKSVFYEELLPQLKRAGKTVFVISHDDRYFELADRVLRFEDGALVSSSR